MRQSNLFIFMILMAAACLPSESLVAAECSGSRPARLTRFPVVFHASPRMMGSHIQKLQAWRYQGKAWSRVPLQIDEVNRDGNYVLEEGIPYTRYTDDGAIDENDELSVVGPSLGDSFSRGNIPRDLVARFSAYERADFCAASGEYLGSLLLARGVTPVEKLPYTPLYKRAQNVVETSRYRYAFRANQPMLMGDVRLKTSEGERPVFAGSSFVMPLVSRVFILPTIFFGEADFTSEIESWRSGPVRSIVAVGAKLRKFFSLIDLHLFSELVFYDDYFQIPTKIEFIFDPSRFLARGSGLAYILKYPEGLQWSVTSNLEQLPSTGPEKGAYKISAYDKAKDGVFAVRGSSQLGSFIANVRVDQKALKQAPPPFVASEESFGDPSLRGAWPWLKKSSGSLGVFIDISGVSRGMYDFALDVALSNQAHDDFTDFQAVSVHWPDPAVY